MPNELLGDIAAQLAGCLLGRDLTAELADKYGIATFNHAVELILDQSEAAARAFIRAMPDGIYACETYLDNDRSGGDALVPIKIKVIVEGDELTVDYTEIAEQAKGPINSGYFGGGQTIARVAFKYLMGADEMANEGTFRPIKLILPQGKLLSADPTAPMFMYPTPFPTAIDAIIKALERALPARVPGGHFGTHSGVRFYGRRPNGSFFDTHDSGHGGWGACATHDGSGPFRTMAHGDTRIIPLELQESLMPFRIEEFSLREDSGGAGKFRGGLGFRKKYRITAPANLGTNLDRTKYPPWGVQGGKEAKPGRFILVKVGATREQLVDKENAYPLQAGDMVCVETGGGGGYGPPAERPLDLIQRDLDAGYVTPAAAERDYGVKVGPDGKARR
jgi:N-methylhydantoinase B